MFHQLLNQEIHTPPEVARKLGVNPVTVHEWIKAGRIEVYKIGARLFVSNEELRRLIKAMTTPFIVKNN